MSNPAITLQQLLTKSEPRLQAGRDYILHGDPTQPLTGLTADSRQVLPGMLFAALPGVKQEGNGFIAEALQRGASSIVADEAALIPPTVTALRTAEPRLVLAHLAAAFYGAQPKHLAAVTGTNGKTSTAQFVREIVTALGHQAASIGTLGVIGPNLDHYGTLTTPDAVTLHKILSELAAAGIDYACVEASSHGLCQNRLDAAHIQAAGFTNLTRDHLDFHGTMEAYRAAKARLFTQVLAADGTAVLNADTPQATILAELAAQRGCRVLTYGQAAGATLRLMALEPHSHGQTLSVELFGQPHRVALPIVGRFQVWNALCAVGLAMGLGLDGAEALQAVGQLTGVHGRLQHVATHASGAAIFVDYAHTPDALETVLTALRPHVTGNGRLLAVFGCGGNRDPGKRPLMGGIAQRLADIAIVTDDNPRLEDPATIRAAILAGCAAQPAVTDIGDRAAAIRHAIGQLQQGDILVIAGKGHEPGQIVGTQVLPFDDAEVARACLG
jgi:UDP-N-acetylmuramoyl-L-alanyl-D-glutamate--2,6-diaminopimelate ligase